MNVKKGRPGILPVKTSRDVTWDSVSWSVEDKSGSELHKHTCVRDCGEVEMFSFKVEVAGVHKYSVKMENEGEMLKCDNVAAFIGELTFGLSFLKKTIRNCLLNLWNKPVFSFRIQ